MGICFFRSSINIKTIKQTECQYDAIIIDPNRETNLNLTQRSSDTKAELVDPFFALTQNYLVKIILPIPLFHPSLVLACST